MKGGKRERERKRREGGKERERKRGGRGRERERGRERGERKREREGVRDRGGERERESDQWKVSGVCKLSPSSQSSFYVTSLPFAFLASKTHDDKLSQNLFCLVML